MTKESKSIVRALAVFGLCIATPFIVSAVMRSMEESRQEQEKASEVSPEPLTDARWDGEVCQCDPCDCDPLEDCDGCGLEEVGSADTDEVKGGIFRRPFLRRPYAIQTTGPTGYQQCTPYYYPSPVQPAPKASPLDEVKTGAYRCPSCGRDKLGSDMKQVDMDGTTLPVMCDACWRKSSQETRQFYVRQKAAQR